MDNLAYLLLSDPEVTGTIPADGFDDFPVFGGQVDLKFNNNIESINNDDVEVVRQDGTPVDNYLVSAAGKKVTVSFNEKLDFNTSYTVTAKAGISDLNGRTLKNDTSVSFTTMGKNLLSTTPHMYNADGDIAQEMPNSGALTAKASVYNPFDEERTAILVMATYAADGRMLSYEVSEETIAGGGMEDISAEIDVSDAVSAAAFVVDNLEEFNLLHTDIATLPKEGGGPDWSMYKGISEASIESITLDDDGFSVSGSVNPQERGVLLLAVKSPSDYMLLAPVYAHDGIFSYGYTHGGNISEGLYNICINGRKLAGIVSETVFYNSPQTKSDFLREINGAASVGAIKPIIEEYGDRLNLGEAYFTNNAYQTLYEQKPYGTYEEVIDMIVGAKKLLDALNKSDWSSLTTLFSENESILLYGNKDYSYYSGLSTAAKGKINMAIVSAGPFSGFTSLRTAFSKAVDDYKKGLENDNSPRGNNSSGVSGQTSVVNVSGASQLPKPSETPPPEESKPAEENGFENVFTDLAGFEWAAESIYKLCSKGVISAADKFRPADNITREEFVKMLVLALELEVPQGSCTFADVGEDAWYCPYVEAARQAGITGGDENGLFGVGRMVTRQDMSVMVYRALAVLERLPEGTSDKENFFDDALISDYAKEGVYALQTRGLVSGVGQGLFSPRSEAGRAQAAKLIYNLVRIADGGK